MSISVCRFMSVLSSRAKPMSRHSVQSLASRAPAGVERCDQPFDLCLVSHRAHQHHVVERRDEATPVQQRQVHRALAEPAGMRRLGFSAVGGAGLVRR